jgi:hypothetical protein
MDDDMLTRRRVLAAGGLGVALGVGGCLRLSDTDSQQAVDTPTERPTASTEATTPTTPAETEPADSSDDYPPGISANSVSDTLVLTHRQAVSNTPRTVESQYMYERRTAQIDGERFFITADRGPDTYIADGRTYQRLQTPGGPIYGYRNDVRREYRPEALTGTGVLEALIAGGNFRPVGTQTANGETTILIESDAITDQTALQSADSISRYFRESEFPLEGFSGSGIVTQQGVIRELSAFIEGSGDSGEFLVRTTDVGSTSVPEPSWTTTASDQEAQFEASLVDDGTYIRAEQVTGQSLDTEFEIDAYDGREYYNGRYTGSSSAGTVFFLYKTDEQTEYGSKKLGISKGSRPSESPAGPWSGRAGWNLSARDLRIVDNRSVA